MLGPLIHPGEMLLEDFLRPLGLQQSIVADELGISRNRLNELVRGKRSVTDDTAIRLERRFKMPARFWMHLQADYDLQSAMNREGNARRRCETDGVIANMPFPRPGHEVGAPNGNVRCWNVPLEAMTPPRAA